MRSMSLSRACIAALLAIMLLTTVTAFAKDGRDFAGYYNVGNPKVDGDNVHLVLYLQIFNNGSADVRNAVVILRQNTGLELVGKTKPIKILRLHDHVNLTQEFTISQHEYETWKQGASQPGVSITYQANGKTWERPIQMRSRDF